MDDEPMWAADRVVALTPGSTITIPEIANEFIIKARNEHVNAVFTRSGKSYDPPVNPNDQNDFETPINFDSDDEDDEPTPQPKPKTSTPKPYKQKIPYPQCLRKVKMKAQYGKFLDMIRAIRINLPLIDVLARMPNYGKFLKELVNNKHRIKQISAAFLSDESSTILQNKVPPKLGDPGSFLIPCNFNKAFSCNTLADLAENMLVEVGKFIFPADFVIIKMEEDSKVPLILERPFLHTVDAVILVKQKQLNLRVGTERMIFHIDSVMKHSYSNDDTCFSIEVINEILEEDFDALLDEGSEILHSIDGTILKEKLFPEFDEFMAMTADENFEFESDTKEPSFEEITFNTDYKIKTSLEEPPKDLELKPLPDNLEYVFLEEPSFLPVIISSQLSEENKNKLKGGITVVTNERNELVPTRTVTGWRVCIDYQKLNEATAKDHFPLPFMDQMRMPFGLCNAPATFQRYMLAIFHDMIEESVKVFKDDFSVFGSSFDHCLNNLDKMLQRCKDAHLVLNWEKCHFMVKEGIVLGHKVSEAGLEVDKPNSTFIKDFSKIARPLTKLLEKDTPFEFNDECQNAFKILKEKLTCAPMIVSPNWSLPFELMCDASDFAIGPILGQKEEFDIEIKDRKVIENVAADHLSRIENEETSDDNEVNNNFLGETLMEINIENEPSFAYFANYLANDIIPKGMTYQQNIFFSDIKHYFWKEPYLFKVCYDGPFPKSYKFEYIFVTVDYVSKSAEAQALPTNDARVVITFLKKLFSRFGMPRALISDRGTHFYNKIMKKTMKRYGLNHLFSTSYHPQTSGQVENTNRALKRIIEKTVKDNLAIWLRKLDDALWAFRTAYKTPMIRSFIYLKYNIK
ncbi:reverse transcriptase domain-containing protein [Tanacetum coccineum]